MRVSSVSARASGYTALESMLMIGLMTVLVLMTWAIYLKETDPKRKGPGVWDKKEETFVPIFHEVGEPLIITPEPSLEADPTLRDGAGEE